jgi:hypothetical protein
MKRVFWLLVAAALLGLAAFLMSRGDKPKRAEQDLKVEFPRRLRSKERMRNDNRKTLPPARPQNDEPAPEQLTRRDPLIVALPAAKNKSTVVVEVAELKDSPVGKAWLDCLMKRDGKRGLDRFQSEFGINPLEDIERVAVSSAPLMVLSVRPDKLKLDQLDFSKRTFGTQGVIYEKELNGDAFATWGDSLVLTGPNAKTIEEAIERLESGKPSEPAIPEWAMYGDIYGFISPEELSRMMPESEDELAEKIQKAVEQVDLHVDASEDVAIVANVEGPGQEDIEDLGKSFGAALALARVKAQDEEEGKLAELLDHAAVHPRGNRFSLDVALPFDLLKEMGPCRKRDEDAANAGDASAPR